MVDGGLPRAVAKRVSRGVHDLRATGGRDYASGHRLLKAERAPDGHDPLTNRDVVGIAKLDRGEFASIGDLEHGNIGTRIRADQLSLILIAVDGDLILLAALHDMVVGDYVAVIREDDPGAKPQLSEFVAAAIASVSIQVVIEGACRGLLHPVDVDGCHGGKALFGNGLGQCLIDIGCIDGGSRG